MNMDRTYLIWALSYAALGMCLGIFMAASQNHAQHVTHAHILLFGFVASFIYATIHKLWLVGAMQRLAKIQFIAHQAGAVTMFTGLLLLYGDAMSASLLEPILAIASITVLSGMLLMLFIVLKAVKAPSALPTLNASSDKLQTTA